MRSVYHIHIDQFIKNNPNAFSLYPAEQTRKEEMDISSLTGPTDWLGHPFQFVVEYGNQEVHIQTLTTEEVHLPFFHHSKMDHIYSKAGTWSSAQVRIIHEKKNNLFLSVCLLRTLDKKLRLAGSGEVEGGWGYEALPVSNFLMIAS